MRCLKPNCGSTDGFYVILTRTVQAHAMDGRILELVVDDEQFGKEPFVCATCGGNSVEFSNTDVDAFWKIFSQRVDRRVSNPKWLEEQS